MRQQIAGVLAGLVLLLGGSLLAGPLTRPPAGESTEGSAPATSLPGQNTGGDKARMADSGKNASKTAARHHRRGHRRHHRARTAKKGAKQ